MELLARNRLRIAQVEDDYDFAHLSERFLKRAGFNEPIAHCDDGLPALRYFLKIKPELAPDVVLLDLHLPKMNGLEVLRWLRQNYSECDVPVFILSSSDEPAYRKQAATIGVTEFLAKRSSFDELIEALDRLIATRNSQRREAESAEPLDSASSKRLSPGDGKAGRVLKRTRTE